MSDRLIFGVTHGRDDPERAILPFIAANTAASVGQSTAILCTIEAVWLGTQGGTDGIEYQSLPSLTELYAQYLEAGGEVWLCGSCTKPRSITEEQLARGARIVGAGMVIEEVINGAKMLNYS
jgi:uncharacterized protein